MSDILQVLGFYVFTAIVVGGGSILIVLIQYYLVNLLLRLDRKHGKK